METEIIKSIDTKYNGYYFRSRLEARWAVFFDWLEIKYLYEHEGFALGNGINYLPDFWLPDLRTFIEIKPRNYCRSANEKVDALAQNQPTNTVLLVEGNPSLGYYNVYPFGEKAQWLDRENIIFAIGRKDRELWLWDGVNGCSIHPTHVDSERDPLPEDDLILQAYEIATTRRFEHGSH